MTTQHTDEMREAFYYVQDKSRGYLGNAPTWWAHNDQGYTAYLEGAKRFTHAEAIEVTSKADDLAMYLCSEIDKRAHLVFDMQDFGRIGTDEPCPWRFGYASQATASAEAKYLPVIEKLVNALEYAVEPDGLEGGYEYGLAVSAIAIATPLLKGGE